jgi:hypothetical protein
MDKQYAIVRSSVLGAILCNILLVRLSESPKILIIAQH